MENTSNGAFAISPTQKKDCFFFVQYGVCSYGQYCKFNHPPKDADSQILQEGSAANLYANSTPKYPCKFFRAGFCKYGSYCGFSHSIPEYPLLQYNSDGLPMRLGERECSFYMNNRWCGYGAACKFHHLELHYSVPQEYYGFHPFGQADLEYLEGPLGSTEGEFLSNNE